jgi:hypothetical protein
MTLHCASRLGVLSYLYEKRHSVAFTIGLISEVPIAMCNNDYDFNEGLVIQEDTERDSTLPPIAFHTQEIHLFCNDFTDLSADANRFALQIDNSSVVIDHTYNTPALSIFHPPS